MKKNEIEIIPESAAGKLRNLINELLQNKIDIQHFCQMFETIYNFEISLENLLDTEAEGFSRLFEMVVLFTPYEEELIQYPGYVTEESIRRAAIEVARILDNSNFEPE